MVFILSENLEQKSLSFIGSAEMTSLDCYITIQNHPFYISSILLQLFWITYILTLSYKIELLFHIAAKGINNYLNQILYS